MTLLIAYIDPGTGSFILQVAIGAVVGAIYIVRVRVGSLFGKFKRGKKPEEPK